MGDVYSEMASNSATPNKFKLDRQYKRPPTFDW